MRRSAAPACRSLTSVSQGTPAAAETITGAGDTRRAEGAEGAGLALLVQTFGGGTRRSGERAEQIAQAVVAGELTRARGADAARRRGAGRVTHSLAVALAINARARHW